LELYAKWVGAKKANWFLNFRFNEQLKIKPETLITDELAALVREIYAKDYELFYP
jgi:hypothetical protein